MASVEMPLPASKEGRDGLFVRNFRQAHAHATSQSNNTSEQSPQIWEIPFLLAYRLLLHPLSKYPGPFLAKLSDGYLGVMAAWKRLHLLAHESHQKHGPIIRVAPSRILFNTATAFRGFSVRTITRNGVYSVFNTLNRVSHRAKRRIVAQAFSDRALRSFTPALVGHVNVCLKQLLLRLGEPINMTTQMSRLAVDVVGKLVLGYELDTQTSEENRFYSRALTVGFFVSNISLYFLPFHELHTNRVFDYLMWQARERFTRLLENMVDFRLALDTHARPDLYLLPNEVRSTFANGDEITAGPQLSSCRYLRACIDESLRMTPPISANLWRQQEERDQNPLFIDGHFIPRGTLFGVNVYALSHNPQIFSDPFSFNPQRWFNADSENGGARKPMLEAFASFLIGPRNCVGKPPFAYLEISIALAKTLWYFDFEPVHGSLGTVGEAADRGRPYEFCTHDGFNSSHDGPYLVFKPRDVLDQRHHPATLRN
ncbi:cytochrome P450 [Xylariaceae sp. FL1272]|nr:cytochrome P450 [Xylariaceae sp. FL1272]